MANATREQATIVDRDIVTMICPNLACRQTVAAPASARGQSIRCAYCNTPFRVPGGGSAARPAEASPDAH